MRRACIFLMMVFFLIIQEVSAADSLFIKAKSNGLPGFSKDKAVSHDIWIRGNKLRMGDKEHRLVTIINLDEEKVIQIDGNVNAYREIGFNEFRKHLSDYMLRRDAIIKRVRTIPEGEGRKQAIEEYGFQSDMWGNIYENLDVTVEETGEKRKINSFNCTQVIIKQFGNKVVVNAWVTDEIKRPENVMKFYADIGIFHKNIVEKMNAVEKFPVEIDMEIDYGTFFKCKVTSEALEIEGRDGPKDLFDVPEGYIKLEGDDLPKTVPCGCCRKQIDGKKAREEGLFFLYDLYIWYFCSKECLEKWKADFIKKSFENPDEEEEEEIVEENAPKKTEQKDDSEEKKQEKPDERDE